MNTTIKFNYPNLSEIIVAPESIVISYSHGTEHKYILAPPASESTPYDAAKFEVGEFVNHDGVYVRIIEEPRYFVLNLPKRWLYNVDDGRGGRTMNVPEFDLSLPGALDE